MTLEERRETRIVRETVTAIRKMGMAARYNGYGEYRVNVPGGKEATAYYTTDADDAVGTAKAMNATLAAQEKKLQSARSPKYIAWQRNDGLVGVSTEAPVGFGDCSFRVIGEYTIANTAIEAANAALGARRPSKSPLVKYSHAHDSECTVDPETDLCRECGVWHAEECPDCHQRAFHSEGCKTLAG